MNSPSHRLSIISVAFNEAKHVARLQSSISRLRKPAGIEVESILVDGGSADGTVDAAHAAGFTKVIAVPGANIPICRNRGVAAAAGDWIAFVDADCEIAEDWLEAAAPLMSANEALILSWPVRPPEPMTWVQAAWHFHWTNKNRQLENFQGHAVVRSEGFRLAATRNMILHQTVFDRMKGFNKDLATGEDTDFAFRAYMAGIPVLGLPSLVVIHHGEPATLKQFFRQQLWHANRRSYQHIMKASGGRVGAHAPLFAMAFLLSALFALAGFIVLLATGRCSVLVMALPLVAIISMPAFAMCWRAKQWKHFPALCAIYAAYGCARAIDLLGFAPQKTSWKA